MHNSGRKHGLHNTYFHFKDATLEPVNTDILFYVKLQTYADKVLFSKFDINLAPIPWTVQSIVCLIPCMENLTTRFAWLGSKFLELDLKSELKIYANFTNPIVLLISYTIDKVPESDE